MLDEKTELPLFNTVNVQMSSDRYDVVDCVPFTEPHPQLVEARPQQQKQATNIFHYAEPPRPKQMMNPTRQISHSSSQPSLSPYSVGVPEVGNLVPPYTGTVKRSTFGTSVKNLTESLQTAIFFGDYKQASEAAQALAKVKASLRIDFDNEEDVITAPMEKNITMRVKVEDKETSGGYITLKVKPSCTIKEMKRHMFFEYSFPPEVQKWIIGNRLPADKETLYKCNIQDSGCTVFLYLMSAKAANLPDKDTYYERQNSRSTMMDMSMVNADYQDYHEGNLEGGQPNIHTGQPLAWPPRPAAQTPAVRPVPAAGRGTLYPQYGILQQPPQDIEEDPPGATLGQVSVRETLLVTPVRRQLSANETGWTCTACTFVNKPTWPGCKMCSANRPDDYHVPTNYEMTPEEVRRIAQEHELDQQAVQAEMGQGLIQRQQREGAERATPRNEALIAQPTEGQDPIGPPHLDMTVEELDMLLTMNDTLNENRRPNRGIGAPVVSNDFDDSFDLPDLVVYSL